MGIVTLRNSRVILKRCAHNSAQLRCFENGNDDFGVESFWAIGPTLRTLVKWFHGSKRFNFTGSWSALYLIGDAARVGYFVPFNGPLNGHPLSITLLKSSSWFDY